LPWGDSEASNGLVPVIYVLEGDALVRRDDRGVALARRVAAAYRTLRSMRDRGPLACYEALARALEHWDQHP